MSDEIEETVSADDSAREVDTEELDTDVPDDEVSLPSQTALSPIKAAGIMGSQITRLVLLGGTQDSGKTTLISSIYERLHLGEFASRGIAWSSTLRGFEEICHEGRESSNRPEPDTLRTPRQAGRLIYHLRLCDASDVQQELLLTDLSGEEFEDIRKFDDVCPNVGIARRADHFCLLLDGDRIVALEERHQAVDEGVTILRVLRENSLLSIETHIQVVFSKWDVVVSSDPELGAEEFVGQTEATFRSQFDGDFASLTFHNVTARAPDGSCDPATNAEELLSRWLNERRRIQPVGGGVLSGIEDAQLRPFDRYGR